MGTNIVMGIRASTHSDGGLPETSEANLLVAGMIVAFFLSCLFLPSRPKSPDEIQAETRSKRLHEIALVADFPIDERRSAASCGRHGAAPAPCMQSEAALRPEAASLWRTSDRYDRLRCLARSEEAPGPAGFIYACLSSGLGNGRTSAGATQPRP